MTQTPLIAMVVIGIGLAFVFGTIAHRIKVSPIAGYLLAGVIVGPFTPGFIADASLALQLAEIGVILLMFGVGLHFSLKDLWSLRRTVIPGAALQTVLSTLLGVAVAWFIGWNIGTGIVFGVALSVASTVVVLRALQDRRLMDTERGHLAIGWLVAQDLVMVVVLVLIPAFASVLKADTAAASVNVADLITALAITFGKVAAFLGFVLIVGRRVIPLILHYVAHTGSRELFRLAVLSAALGVAFLAAELFGVSFALGAFFAGVILSESQLSARAAEESLPLRDAFAVLFFVSVGMLFNPTVLLNDTRALVACLLVVVVGNAGIAFGLTRLLGYSSQTALLLAAALPQIGEFSFILADLGIELDILTPRARDLILGTSILSILANPLLFAATARMQTAAASPKDTPAPKHEAAPNLQTTSLTGHAVLIGFGRVGSLIGQALLLRNEKFLVIEDADSAIAALHQDGIEVLTGNAVRPEILAAANISKAKLLFIAIPNGFEAGQIVGQARALNPQLEIIARAHSNDEVNYLSKLSADAVVMGEREIARGMVEHAYGTVEMIAPSPSPEDNELIVDSTPNPVTTT